MILSESLLEALLSPVAATRLAAEAQWSQSSHAARIQGCVAFLLQQKSSPQHYRHFTAVLLRREILQLSSPNDMLTLVPALWQLFHQEVERRVQTALGFCLAECCRHEGIARTMILESSLSSSISSPTALLSLWTAVVERSSDVALPEVRRLYEHCVRLGPAGSEWILPFLEFLVLMATKLERESLAVSQLGQQYLPQLLPELRSLVLQPQPTDSPAAWAWTLQTAALEVPDLLQSCWFDVLDLCGHLLHSNPLAFEEDVELCLPVAALVASILHIPYVKRVTMMAAESNAPSLQPVLQMALHTCWQVLRSAEDEALEPASLQDSAPDDEEDMAHAKEVLADLLRAWPHSAVSFLVPILQEAPTPRASLHAWQCLVEAIPAALGAPGWIHATHIALAALHSTVPSVQYQAVRLLGILCECPGTENEETAVWFPKILEALTHALHSKETAIVALACRAMVSYIRPPESSSSRPMLPYLADVIQALVTGPLQSVPDDAAVLPQFVVQIRAVETLGALAASLSSEDALRPYYSLVMPGLLSYAVVLDQPRVHEYALVRAGASVEAATLWGPADPDLFYPDAERLLQGTVAALEQQVRMEPERLWAACARIAAMFPDTLYAPYLGRVLPLLLRRVTDPADVEFADGDISDLDTKKPGQAEYDAETGTERMTVAIPGRGLTQVTLHTTKFQEKAQAARAIYEQAVALQSTFGPYCPACFEAFLPLVNFVFSTEIRATAAQTIAAVFEAACSHGDDHADMQVPKSYLPKVLKNIALQLPLESNALDIETVHALAESLQDICRTVFFYTRDGGDASLLEGVSRVDVEQVVQNCLATMVLCLERRLKLSETLSEGPVSGADERNELTAQLQQEEDLLTPLVDSIGYLLKCLGPHFAPIFEQYVVPVLGPYVTTTDVGSTTKDVRARLSAICLFDDCVEYCGAEAANQFGPLLIQGILFGMNDDNHNDLELKRVSIYGIAQMARNASPNILAPHISYLMQQLRQLTSGPKHLCSDDLTLAVYENAISAMASLVLFDHAPFRINSETWIKRNEMVLFFLNNLPLQQDDDEAYICHKGLCDLIEQGSVDLREPKLFSATVLCVHKVLEWMAEENNTGSPKDDALISRLQSIQTVLQQSPGYHSSMYNVTSPCSAAEYP